MWNVSVGDVVFLQPLRGSFIESDPDRLIECEVTKVARKYVYLRPVNSELPDDYARVERETYEYYNYNKGYGWVLWPSYEDFIQYNSDTKILYCIIGLCQEITSMVRKPVARRATQLASETIHSVCAEMVRLTTSVKIDLKSEHDRSFDKEDVIELAQSAVQSYIRGEVKPHGVYSACTLIDRIVKNES